MNLFPTHRALSRVTAVAARRPVHEAFAWLHGHPKTMLDWQTAMVAIPAPPFGETARGLWFAQQLTQMGIPDVRIDAAGNVIALLNPLELPRESPVIVLSAHLDTVFPAGTLLTPQFDGDRILAPGICDNCAGLTGLLAVAQALVYARIALNAPLCLLANTGEEGEGDLRGVRHFYQHDALAGRIAAHIVLDGAGAEPAVTKALGSRRFKVTLRGSGGHSFTDYGTPNPIAALSSALHALWQTPLPEEPRTTMNLGVISGGTSVNAIPESAAVSIDFRSTQTDQLDRLEAFLHGLVEQAVEEANSQPKLNPLQTRRPLSFQIEKIGDRPAALLAEDSPLLVMLRAVDRHLVLQTEVRLGSTDANLPLSLGVPAVSLGAGGDGGGAHTLAEWYSAKDRELGLKRILLLTLAMLDWAAGL